MYINGRRLGYINFDLYDEVKSHRIYFVARL